MTGEIVVFGGPTLSAADVGEELPASCLPPVAQGDVYRAAQRRPWAIGIVDGYFERVPAVWHKEILWAMAQGVHVYGAASMGALRAAELAPFGMVGVGAIFEAYRDGDLTDDDEVAVAHGAAEDGYRPQSEALVNIRATLAAAEAAGVVSRATEAALVQAAKTRFYPDRAWPLLLSEAALRQPSGEIAALRRWLPKGRVDQKRDDALAMLRAMAAHRAADPGPKRATFRFEHTTFWDRVTRSASPLPGAGAAIPSAELLEEVRLDARASASAEAGAMLRDLALGLAAREGWDVTPDAVRRTTNGFRRSNGLLHADQVARWLEANGLTREGFAALMREETLIRWAREECASSIASRLVDHLRATGDYPRLARRARDKTQVLASNGLENPALHDLGITADGLVRWYFGRIGQPVPASSSQYAKRTGFASESAFLRALARDYAYVRVREAASA